MPDPTAFFALALLIGFWLFTTVIVLAACRMAAEADRGVTVASKPTASDHVPNGAQHYLEIPPKRPVRHIQIVDSSHLA